MARRWRCAGKPARIATPTQSWEIQGFRVNEGPAVLVRNGRVFMTFSASATDARYCMGLLTADARADLLDARSWTKTPDPVFVTNEQTRQYGPGHNSFTVAEDGETDVLVYHARDYRDIVGDPLYDPNRHTRVQRLYWHRRRHADVRRAGRHGRPDPAAVARWTRRGRSCGTPSSCSGSNGDVRELADTQFRFVPGLAGAGTESHPVGELPRPVRAGDRGRHAPHRPVRGHRHLRPRVQLRSRARPRRPLGGVPPAARDTDLPRPRRQRPAGRRARPSNLLGRERGIFRPTVPHPELPVEAEGPSAGPKTSGRLSVA